MGDTLDRRVEAGRAAYFTEGIASAREQVTLVLAAADEVVNSTHRDQLWGMHPARGDSGEDLGCRPVLRPVVPIDLGEA